MKSLYETPAALCGVKFEPLELHHTPELIPALLHPGSFFYEVRGIRTPEQIEEMVRRNVVARQRTEPSSTDPTRPVIKNAVAGQHRIPWLVRIAATDEVAGITCLIEPNAEHRSLEIGGTWVANRWQRTWVNTATKRAILTHSFEKLGCIRVCFKVDAENTRSQVAVARLGARLEGTLRSGWVFDHGRDRRDVRVYSILDTDWPEVRARLERYLRMGPGSLQLSAR